MYYWSIKTRVFQVFFLIKFVVIFGSVFKTILKCDLHYKLLFPDSIFDFRVLFVQ